MQVIEWFWRETLICDGMESALDRCRYKLNHALPDCMIERGYVYVRCGPRNLPAHYEYWGSVRVSFPDYELGDFSAGYSSLSNLDVYGAGILHNEKVAVAIFRATTWLPSHLVVNSQVFTIYVVQGANVRESRCLGGRCQGDDCPEANI